MMEWINEGNILVVGLGLMGGSYAKVLSRMGYHVVAIDRNEDSIAYAIEEGIIENGATYPDEKLIASADCIIFALYPKIFVEWIKENQKFFKPGIFITDVTGVKGSVVYDVQSILRDDVEFIAAHPMAGREVYGVRNSDEHMFHDANYIVVPTEKNSKEAVTEYRVLETIGNFSFLELKLKTGRTHQIRVHMSSIGHPVAGDPVYGPKKVITELEGQCLHAGCLGFIHPSTGEYMEFNAELPEYFTSFLDKLRRMNNA